jgi:uncharacterized ferredoxin-like protein
MCSAGGAESGDVLLDHLAGVKANGQALIDCGTCPFKASTAVILADLGERSSTSADYYGEKIT